MNFAGTWRDYQARALEELALHLGDDRVHLVAAPGSGKTVLGLEIVRRMGRPALILAPTLAIRDQWADRLHGMFLSAQKGAWPLSHDLRAPATLTLATYQALDTLRRADGIAGLAEALGRIGPVTLVLDEAHHLRREWWKSLEALVAARPGKIVALTATPPYDSGFDEWQRYESLCGPIDLEIGIPELVRNGDLCPHQDHVLLSQPTEDALILLDRHRRAISELQQSLWADASLLNRLAAHPWLTAPDEYVEDILEAPELLSAILVQLHCAGRPLPRAALSLLGVSRRDVPPPSWFWLEVLLEGMTGPQAEQFGLDAQAVKQLRARLHGLGLIEGGRVRLHQPRSILRRMAASLAKLDSILAIARAERAALGPRLRMVILADHIRAGELPVSASDAYRPTQLGVVPIFETLRRAGAGETLGVLTGTLVIVPRAALANLDALAAGLRLGPVTFRASELPGCPEHVRLDPGEGGPAGLVRLVTAGFMQGDIGILVGTQSLLGEGWDAPALNSLVLASNTASFMLSNQMRGRAIRIDPADPDKVANIWHLATVETLPEGLFGHAQDSLDWGYLGDDDLAGTFDATLLERRFRAFEGIANGGSTLIESGIGRLGIDPAAGIEAINERSFALAADRPGIAERWAVSLGEAGPRARVRDTAAPDYVPRRLSWSDTLRALLWNGLTAGAFAASLELRHVESLQSLSVMGMVIAGAAAFASLPILFRALRLLWRNGSLEASLRQVGEVVLKSLYEAGLASGEDVMYGQFEIRVAVDGRRDIILSGVSRNTERLVMEAIAELLGPVRNPRYLLVRRSWLGLRGRTDYHAVPSLLGTRKEAAAQFALFWKRQVGSSRLVYTRTPEGRRLLLRARARSFAAGFRRSVDRRSAWL